MAIQVTKRPYNKCFSGNPVHYELYSALAASDSSIFFEVKIMFKAVTASSFEEVITLPYYPVEGYAQIDIKDILHAQLIYGVLPFYADEKTVWGATGQSGYFYLQYREITTQNSNPSWDASEAAYAPFILKGGLNYFAWRGNNFWVNYYPTKLPFLTWQKSGRLAASTERMYLAWLNDTDVASGNLRAVVKVYYTDGTQSDAQTQSFAAAKGVVYYIPAGFSQWGLATLDPTKNVYYWTMQVMDYTGTPTAVSELFQFELDNRNNYNNIVLHYRNSLGGLDSLRLRGEVQEDLNYNFSEQQSTITPNYYNGYAIQPQRVINDNQEQLTYKGDIGHLGKEEQDRLRDAFIQREVYWEILKKWWPVIITSKSNKLRKTTDTRWTMPIEFELAVDGNGYYTPNSMLANLGDGVFTDNVCLATIAISNVVVDVSGTEAAVTATVGENDPQNASAQVRYRVSGYIDWTVANYGVISFSLPKEITPQLEVQAICTNNVYGATASTQIDTRTDTGGNTGGGDPGSNWLTCTMTNNRAAWTDWELTRDGVIVATGNIGSYGEITFQVPPIANNDIGLQLNFSPSSVYLDSMNGMIYTTQITWTDIYVDHDFSIIIY